MPDTVSVAVLLTPFAKIGGQKGAKRRGNDLSDDEELEKIQIEQGRATFDRLVEANDFDPEVSEMLRNVLTLSETLTREVMVPRTDMICIERGETLENMLKLCSRPGSRVCRSLATTWTRIGGDDNITGRSPACRNCTILDSQPLRWLLKTTPFRWKSSFAA